MGLFSKSNSGNGAKGASKNTQMLSDIIVNTIADGVLLVDKQGIIQLFNPSATKLTGWLAEEAINLDYRSVIKLVNDKNEPYNEQNHPVAKALANGTPILDTSATLITKSNNQIAVDFSTSPLTDASKEITGTVAVFRDVSQQRNEERQRADFISTASHEMRTPVAAIEGYLALALNPNVSSIDAKSRSYLEKAHSSTQHLGKLFQDLLTSAKAEDGRLSNHPVLTEMGEFVEKLADDLRFSAIKKGLDMRFVSGNTKQSESANLSGGKQVRPLFYCNVDPDRMREVITNLFDNAVKYTDSGSVEIGITGDKNVVQLYIKDTGAGIPAEDIPHLFQKFYRVDSSSTRTVGGTGLGLFICRKIIELYKGRIWVESTLDKGSTFYMNIPRFDTMRAEQMLAHNQQTNTTIPGQITRL